MRFVKESLIAASAARVFAFHERKDAFALLQPPWQKAEVVRPPTSLSVGTRVIVRTKVGPFYQTIEAEHVAYEPGHMFADRMVKGPFKRWYHRHSVLPKGEHASLLRDEVDYELPLGLLGRIVGGAFAHRELTRLFAYRHLVTRAACEGTAPWPA
jgi:ligand-binding SRPBCC domain-containing protein